MRIRRTALIAAAVTCACAGGPALAAVAGKSATPAAGSGTGPLTRTFPTSTTTTTTTTTSTTTYTATPVPNLSVCLKATRVVIAHLLGVKVSEVRVKQRAGSNGMPQCNYLVKRARALHPHTRAVVAVNVDNGPQAAWRLMRKNVEASQIWGPIPPGWKHPIGIYGLGPYAAWYPDLDQLIVNNVSRRYILTVSIVWWRAKQAEMIRLARQAVVPYRPIRRYAPFS